MVAGVGGQVAGYRIDAFVGRGGGGVVYQATHLRLGRTAALKLLAPELAADGVFQRRFEREALMAGRLDHPHIIPIYDAGVADGTLYLVTRRRCQASSVAGVTIRWVRSRRVRADKIARSGQVRRGRVT